MQRVGLAIGIGLAAAVAAVFAVHPRFDLDIARALFRHWLDQPLSDWRSVLPAVIAVLALLPLAGLVLKFVGWRFAPAEPMRALVFLWSTLLLGPGLLVNILLKQYSGRARPIEIFNNVGAAHFVPWFDPAGGCQSNCSFVSGEVAIAAWTLAPAALAPPHYRPFAYAASLALTAIVGLQRLVAGAHFFTDVMFAAASTFLIVWVAYAILYRWPTVAASKR